VLRSLGAVRPLSEVDQGEALDLCALDPPASVFVAARIVEGTAMRYPGALLGYRPNGRLEALCWAAANIVPVAVGAEAAEAFVPRLRRLRRQTASVFGPSDQVELLWSGLMTGWSPARTIRARQPLMATTTSPSALGIDADLRVRVARPDEVSIVLPAAAAMFTAEIGYPPYRGSDVGYRRILRELLDRGHTFVWEERGEILFKADVGSCALGEAQLQGVWLTPRLRGRGLGVPLVASVTEQVLDTMATSVSLYVNEYNLAARAVYRRVGFATVGEFTTVLM
jgi:predicted GNAT family acetyltransferase